jgi:chromosome segregation ATPase
MSEVPPPSPEAASPPESQIGSPIEAEPQPSPEDTAAAEAIDTTAQQVEKAATQQEAANAIEAMAEELPDDSVPAAEGTDGASSEQQSPEQQLQAAIDQKQFALEAQKRQLAQLEQNGSPEQIQQIAALREQINAMSQDIQNARVKLGQLQRQPAAAEDSTDTAGKQAEGQEASPEQRRQQFTEATEALNERKQAHDAEGKAIQAEEQRLKEMVQNDPELRSQLEKDEEGMNLLTLLGLVVVGGGMLASEMKKAA